MAVLVSEIRLIFGQNLNANDASKNLNADNAPKTLNGNKATKLQAVSTCMNSSSFLI